MTGSHTHDGYVSHGAFAETVARLERAIALLQPPPTPVAPPPPPPVAALPAFEVMRDTRFQQGDWIPGTPLLSGTVEFTADPLRERGGRVVRVHSKGRAEFHHSDHATDGDGKVYVYDTERLIEEDCFLRKGTWRIILQTHENGTKPANANAGSPPFSAQLDEAQRVLKVMRKRPGGGFTTMWSAPLAAIFGRWFRLTFVVRWSKGNDGWFEAYLDGQRVCSFTGPTLVADDGRSPYSKGGVYEGSSGETVAYVRRHTTVRAEAWDPRLLDVIGVAA